MSKIIIEPSNSWFLSPEKIYFIRPQNLPQNIWWEQLLSLFLHQIYDNSMMT